MSPVLWISTLFAGAWLCAKETALPVFDDREWVQLTYSSETEEPQKRIFAPKNNPHQESLTLIQQTGKPFDSIHKMKKIMKISTKLVCQNAKWQWLSQKTNDLLWQWTTRECLDEPRFEIVRAASTDEGMHLFIYSSQEKDISKRKQNSWQKNLRAIPINKINEMPWYSKVLRAARSS